MAKKTTVKPSSSESVPNNEEESLANLRSEFEAFRVQQDQQFAGLKAELKAAQEESYNKLLAFFQNQSTTNASAPIKLDHPLPIKDGVVQRGIDRGKAPMIDVDMKPEVKRNNSAPPTFPMIPMDGKEQTVGQESFQHHAPVGTYLYEDRPYILDFEGPQGQNARQRPYMDNNRNEENFRFMHQTRGDKRFRKLELPMFYGSNVNEWIQKVEWYFEVNGLQGHDALVAATMSLEDKAFKWYKWYSERQNIHTWQQLKSAIIARFQGADPAEIPEKFFSLMQKKSVMEYREEFEDLAGSIVGVPEEFIMANFYR